uniref:C2 calcium dependent membrane targeting n=1 Tax=Echinococcus granulosus TaxID=6210 RepID=A0A068WD52_ECHGR|nr:C2 calcium dependent membrane targeting [Echinococcus granulosus]
MTFCLFSFERGLYSEMPAAVKVKVLAARNLPVMDRTSFLTDAFVEVRLGNTMFKTEVIRRTLNPEWNSDWFCFELNEEALLEEALQVRVLDHDTYSAHDAIGRVYVDLTPLLQTEQKRTLNGWFPLYDTMHGIRGEINLAVRVDLFSDACRQRFSSLGVRFFFSSSIPSGYRVISLIGFVRELVMNDDPEHQWIEKIRTSRASNEARQCLFSQLAGELQSKLSRKVLSLGGNAVIGYRLHFDLEGDTGIVARAIGTAVRLQRSPTNSQLRISLLRKNSEKGDSEVETKVPVQGESDAKPYVNPPIGGYALSSPKPLNAAEFPFLTISHPPRGLIRHFGSVIVARSVKLLDKNATETVNSRVAWWLELRTEALTRMYNVGCDALVGYREECTIYEDICVLSVSATAVTLNQLWTHFFDVPGPSSFRPSKSSSLRQGRCIFSLFPSPYSPSRVADIIQNERDHVTDIPSGLPVSPNPKGVADNSPWTCSNYDCSVCHIPSLNQALPPNKSMRCRVCRVAFVPEFLLSTTDFPPELSVVGRPSFIQVGLSRSKKVEKGESAAREISELRGMNAIFGLSLQLAIGEDLVVVLATGTGVCIPALPSAQLPKVCPVSGNLSTLHTDLLRNLRTFNDRCCVLFGIPKEAHGSLQIERENGYSDPFDSLEGGVKAGKEEEVVATAVTKRSGIIVPNDSVTNEKDHSEHASTYFVDAREPEPEELNSLLSDPLPPPGLLFSTTDYLPNDESFAWLVKIKREQSDCASNSFSWRRLYSFVKVHTIQTLKADDALGSMLLCYSNSGPLVGDISLPILHSSTSFDSTLNAPLVNKCMAKCLRDCNQLTWFHFRCVMPCAITSLRYRLTVVDDDVVQIICSGVALSLSNEESASCKNISLGVLKAEGQKLSVSNTRRSLFNRPKGFRSVPVMEPKTISQASEFESNYPEQSAGKSSNKKAKWWKPFSKDSSASRSEASTSAKFSDGLNDRPNAHSGFDTSEGKCILTPSPKLLDCEGTHYLGSYSFFFVRETNDLREMGGLRCFIHAAVMEAQAVAAAHTVGLGGNALLSYQITDLLITRPASRNQAQCLVNLCGDMARTSAN